MLDQMYSSMERREYFPPPCERCGSSHVVTQWVDATGLSETTYLIAALICVECGDRRD